MSTRYMKEELEEYFFEALAMFNLGRSVTKKLDHNISSRRTRCLMLIIQ